MRARVETVRIEGLPVRLRTLAPAGRRTDRLAPTVVLVHGIGMSHRSFTRTQRQLARDHRTVAVDLPGFGGLPAPGRTLSIEDFADLVVGAVRAAGVDRAVLVGQSMGTQVVADAALRYPDLVESVVLIGPVVDERRRSLLLQAIDLGRDCLVEGVRMNAVVLTDYLRSFRQYTRALRPMLTYPLRRTVERLAVPVLVVRGTVDPIGRRAWARQVAASAASGVLVELPGPHHVQEHQPVAFAELVAEFQRVQTLERTR